MAHNDTEIEVKFPLKNPLQVISFLNSNAEKMLENNVQKDTYFTPVHRDFLNAKFPFEWLRLRECVKGISLNYKHFYPENEKIIDYCDEFETTVDNPIIKKIFKCLDFKELTTVEKNRTTWMFKDVEIAIDKVKDLGSFIELEITTHFDDPKEAKKILYELTKEIGAEIGEEDYRGYPFLLLEQKGYNFKY
jgi:predicted adenylyl cyclase CyaB|tara:strand:- start:16 stop:588 length:573 start_codon:yes stop_codon:yes gene_type:complete